MLIINNSTGYNYIAIISNRPTSPVIIATNLTIVKIDIFNCFKIKKVCFLASCRERGESKT